MNTLNYIGSKHTLCSTILDIVKKELGNIKLLSFIDLFAGTGTIGYNFQDYVAKCGANDLELYSFVINKALLKCNYSEKLQSIIDNCNKLTNIQGLIYSNYSENDNCERMFFSNDNASKCDAIRLHINELLMTEYISEFEYNFLLASLLVSIDKVANTSCVYGAYLKKYKTSALKPLKMVPIHTKTNINTTANNVFNMKAETLCLDETNSYDIVYMDPPYNQRQYSANYSPLNYIAQYDPNIVLTGKTGLIENYNKSDFCSKVKVKHAFASLLDGLKCKYMFISYNNEGLIDYEDMKIMLSKYGKVKLYKIPYKKFKAQMSVDIDTVYEYLWYIDTTQAADTTIEIINLTSI